VNSSSQSMKARRQNTKTLMETHVTHFRSQGGNINHRWALLLPTGITSTGRGKGNGSGMPATDGGPVGSRPSALAQRASLQGVADTAKATAQAVTVVLLAWKELFPLTPVAPTHVRRAARNACAGVNQAAVVLGGAAAGACVANEAVRLGLKHKGDPSLRSSTRLAVWPLSTLIMNSFCVSAMRRRCASSCVRDAMQCRQRPLTCAFCAPFSSEPPQQAGRPSQTQFGGN
jgi:hypothetical protein